MTPSETFAVDQLHELLDKLRDGSFTLLEFRIVCRPIQERERLVNPNIREISIVYEVTPP